MIRSVLTALKPHREAIWDGEMRFGIAFALTGELPNTGSQ